MPNTDTHLDWALVAEYLFGDMTADARTEMERRIDADPVLQDTVAALRHGLLAAHPVLDSQRLQAAEQRLGDAMATLPVFEQRATSRVTRRTMGRFAATLGVACVALIGGTLLFRNMPQDASTVRTYEAPAGSQLAVTLSDGSYVILGPATQMVVTETRDGTSSAHVSGQALFTVTHNARTAFQVATDLAEVRVLGTKFLVRHYADEAESRVVVMDGRVAVTNVRAGTPSRVVLDAGAMAEIGDSSAPFVSNDIATDDYVAWTKGKLVFHRTPAHSVATELGRAYGVRILADSSLANQPLTWTVPIAQRSLSDVVDLLAALLNGHVVTSGKTITIAPGRRMSKSPASLEPSSPQVTYGR